VGLQSFEMPPKDLEGLYRDASVHFASGSCHRVEQNSKTSKSPGGAKLENIEITGWNKICRKATADHQKSASK
jgi:hypothetical protein